MLDWNDCKACSEQYANMKVKLLVEIIQADDVTKITRCVVARPWEGNEAIIEFYDPDDNSIYMGCVGILPFTEGINNGKIGIVDDNDD